MTVLPLFDRIIVTGRNGSFPKLVDLAGARAPNTMALSEALARARRAARKAECDATPAVTDAPGFDGRRS